MKSLGEGGSVGMSWQLYSSIHPPISLHPFCLPPSSSPPSLHCTWMKPVRKEAEQENLHANKGVGGGIQMLQFFLIFKAEGGKLQIFVVGGVKRRLNEGPENTSNITTLPTILCSS